MRRELEHPYLTASITGIDGAGKSTVSEIVTSQFPPDVNIAKFSRPVYSIDQNGKRGRYTGLMTVVDKFHGFADFHQNRRLSLAANALDVVLQGRLIEPGLIRRVDPQLVLGTRDYLIDPSVYSIFYSGFLGRKTPEERVKFFQGVTGSRIRDVIFFLTVPPQTAVERIEKRISEEAEANNDPSARLKWRHMHEVPEYLEKLQEEYYRVLQVIKTKGDPSIYEIDTSHLTKEEVVGKIMAVLRTRVPYRTQPDTSGQILPSPESL